MNNPFQEQLLKAGIVTKQQVQKTNKYKIKKNKQQRSNNEIIIDETKLKAQKATKENAARDRELNRKKEENARNKAISAEINQLITENCIARVDNCEIAYNFEHMRKVKRIYINKEMQQQIIQGKLGIARITGRYELVPKSIAEKIRQRNEKRVVLFANKKPTIDENDSYADYQIPDDLTW